MVNAAIAFLAFSSIYPPNHKKELLGLFIGDNWSWIQSHPLLEVAIRLLAISHEAPKTIDSTCVALLAKRLITLEVAAGGPYKDTNRGSHIDIATNIVIAQLFAQFGGSLTNLERYVQSDAHTSIHVPQPIVSWLLHWPTDLGRKKADTLYITSGQSIQQTPISSQRVMTTIDSLKEPLRTEALAVWHSVNAANKQLEITHLATFFGQSLARPPATTHTLYRDLGEANFYTWMAYTTYDDFIDNEGIERRLSVANSMHRRALLLYANHAPPSINVWQYFDQMDEANAWELVHCRANVDKDHFYIDALPRYKTLSTLAARSSAHILGPLIITATNHGYTTLKTAEAGLRHYLIARQLNDDLHDWKKDLEKGHLSPVVSHLLEKTGMQRGHFTISEITPLLQRYFWRKGLGTITRQISYHIKKSKKLLLKDNLITDKHSPFFTNVLTPIEISIRRTNAAWNEQKQFLDTYSSM